MLEKKCVKERTEDIYLYHYFQILMIILVMLSRTVFCISYDLNKHHLWHRGKKSVEDGGISETRSRLYKESKGRREEEQRGGYRSIGDTYIWRDEKGDEGERERKALRGRERKWPVQGGWNHLGFRYIER